MTQYITQSLYLSHTRFLSHSLALSYTNVHGYTHYEIHSNYRFSLIQLSIIILLYIPPLPFYALFLILNQMVLSKYFCFIFNEKSPFWFLFLLVNIFFFSPNFRFYLFISLRNYFVEYTFFSWMTLVTIYHCWLINKQNKIFQNNRDKKYLYCFCCIGRCLLFFNYSCHDFLTFVLIGRHRNFGCGVSVVWWLWPLIALIQETVLHMIMSV